MKSPQEPRILMAVGTCFLPSPGAPTNVNQEYCLRLWISSFIIGSQWLQMSLIIKLRETGLGNRIGHSQFHSSGPPATSSHHANDLRRVWSSNAMHGNFTWRGTLRARLLVAWFCHSPPYSFEGFSEPGARISASKSH